MRCRVQSADKASNIQHDVHKYELRFQVLPWLLIRNCDQDSIDCFRINEDSPTRFSRIQFGEWRCLPTCVSYDHTVCRTTMSYDMSYVGCRMSYVKCEIPLENHFSSNRFYSFFHFGRHTVEQKIFRIPEPQRNETCTEM